MNEDRFCGCLLGGLLGDVIGAPVEGESPKYLRKAYASVDEILARPWVEEILGQRWLVGRYTDDTQMTLCVVEWLLHDSPQDGKALLARFSEAYRPARRYGSGAARLLEAFPEHHQEWRSLATLQFPEGSYGNGAPMRVAPIGLTQSGSALIEMARLSARVTHAHPLAQIGAVLHATAVREACCGRLEMFGVLHQTLAQLERQGLDTREYSQRLERVESGLQSGRSCASLAEELGTGVSALESVPVALYCFLSHPQDFERVIHEAIFVGGDVDTLASMAGALSGAYLGLSALPRRWLARVREEEYPPGRIHQLGRELWRKFPTQDS